MVEVKNAIEDVLLGASLRQIAAAYRQGLIDAFGFRELTRDFYHAKSGLERGRGVLFVLDLDPPR